jgi:hypothetical protein
MNAEVLAAIIGAIVDKKQSTRRIADRLAKAADKSNPEVAAVLLDTVILLMLSAPTPKPQKPNPTAALRDKLLLQALPKKE